MGYVFNLERLVYVRVVRQQASLNAITVNVINNISHGLCIQLSVTSDYCYFIWIAERKLGYLSQLLISRVVKFGSLGRMWKSAKIMSHRKSCNC